MIPYYEDKLVTIYNSPTDRFESEVIVLDPPYPLANANIYKAEVYYIFCGKKSTFYREQFPNMRANNVLYHIEIPDGNESTIYTDMVLVLGKVLVPGRGVYPLNTIDKRFHKWERPLEFMLNALGSSKGDVLDPYMGSGSSLVAAKMLGRKAIGFDIDEHCCKVAMERLIKI